MNEYITQKKRQLNLSYDLSTFDKGGGGEISDYPAYDTRGQCIIVWVEGGKEHIQPIF